MKLKTLLHIIVFSITCAVSSQSLQHPVIFATAEERGDILNLIENYDWAQSINAQLHKQVDFYLNRHKNNPNSILETIPKFASNSKQNTEFEAAPYTAKHYNVLSIASKSAMLYYLTQQEKYAQFSLDILKPYVNHLSKRTIKNTTISGNAFYDPRTAYGAIAVAYDFIHPYIKKKNAIAFNKKAQKALSNMIGDVLQEYGKPDVHGSVVSNHPILTAPGALFTILCIEDDVERERLFNVFWEKGTAHQNSFKNTLLPIFSKQGIWPESLSYSFMSPVSLVLNLVDRVKPELKVTDTYKYILEGNCVFDNLRYADRRFVRYGDSKREKDYTEDLYRYTLHMATRNGYDDLKQKAQIALKQSYNFKGGFKPFLSDDIFNNYEELMLFWGVPLPKSVEGAIDFETPTVIIEHAGIALQRNNVKKNNETYGLCGIIGGAHYVHSHVTGIGMELYGANYVMAPGGGLPKSVKERRIPLHENYFRLYGGNNTVIVNGTSHGRDEGSWKGKAHVWQNTAVNIAAEPKHLEAPISPNFNFAIQHLNDAVNNAEQQRTLSIVRTSETTGYYFDMFRSKSLEKDKFHDYIYHNIGDGTHILNSDFEKLKVSKTKRYKNDIGDPVQSPGWRYFEKTKVTEPTNEAVNIQFNVKQGGRYMHLFVPRGIEREYTKALAPATREAKNGYDEKKTQVLAIRQQGEAWKRPFTLVLEPTVGKETSVKKVTQIMLEGDVVGVKVISEIDKGQIIDYIFCNEDYKTIALPEYGIVFNGRFGIVRHEASSNKVTLYIGDGTSLQYKSHSLTLDKINKGIKTF